MTHPHEGMDATPDPGPRDGPTMRAYRFVVDMQDETTRSVIMLCAGDPEGVREMIFGDRIIGEIE